MIPLVEQLAVFDDFAPRALEAAREYGLGVVGIDVIRLARARLCEGFEVYGDEMFRQSEAELLRECSEEFADILNRMVAKLSLRG